MIKPTVGRVVWYFEDENQTTPWAAIVCFVHDDTRVNLAVFDPDGFPHQRPSVFLRQGDTDTPSGPRAEWMPYQLGQAAKTEQLEKQLQESK